MIRTWMVLVAVAGVASAEEPPVSLRNEVLPILSRLNCSSGACHGSPKGKGEFRLSLRAFDPTIDEKTLRVEYSGRRVSPLSPDSSLLLRKPLMQIPHAGGHRMIEGSPEHLLLRRWIAEVAKLDAPETARCQSIALSPAVSSELSKDTP
ncbi:MAG TPA: S-layer protein, partial [Planctomycetaceae bacterium]|nr:S-layer protein [Planctomycetaceae bacterium]